MNAQGVLSGKPPGSEGIHSASHDKNYDQHIHKDERVKMQTSTVVLRTCLAHAMHRVRRMEKAAWSEVDATAAPVDYLRPSSTQKRR